MSSMCVISGKLVGPDGVPFNGCSVVVAPFLPGNRPIFSADGELVAREELSVLTNELGEFAVSVIQGLQVQISIDAVGYTKQTTIPMQTSVNLKDL